MDNPSGGGGNLTTGAVSSSMLVNGSVAINILQPGDGVPLNYAMIMFGYIMPVLMVVTILANTLVVIVLAQRHMRTPTNIVLLTMAISDLLTLMFPAPWYFYLYTLGNYREILYPVAACYAFHVMTEVIPAFFHTASIWLTLVLAGQRYIYVCHPITARTWCTLPRVNRAMLLTFMLAFLHQLPRFFDRTFNTVAFEQDGIVHRGCHFETAEWVRNLITEPVYFITYYVFRIIFVHVGPCLILLILNLLLFKALRRAQTKRDELFKDNRKSKESRKMRESNCTTLMLIVVVTVFLSTETPLAVCTVLHVVQNALQIVIANYDLLNSTILFTNFFIMCSYSINFAIYCGMSRQFRETFKNLFLGNTDSARESRLTENVSRVSATNGPRITTG